MPQKTARLLAWIAAAALISAFALWSDANAQRVAIGTGSVTQSVAQLRPGEYVWAPQLAPSGPVLVVINLATQRAIVFRNGVPVGASTVSTGRPGYETPTGVFTILQKRVEHYSSTYDNAPMPYMQRLTWRGVALHAGRLPGYPASHGCIRLPLEFAKLLYGTTAVGMTVVITNRAASPRIAPPPAISAADPADAATAMAWNPAAAPDGPVSIVVSAADRRAFVLRNGVIIGSAPVEVAGKIPGSWAYTLRAIEDGAQQWIRLNLDGNESDGSAVDRREWTRFRASDDFRRKVASILAPGSTIVVTPDSLRAGSTGTALTVMEAGEHAER